MKKVNKLKEYRVKNDYSKEDIAFLLGITSETVSNMELLRCGISAKNIYMLSKLYDESMETIYLATLKKLNQE